MDALQIIRAIAALAAVLALLGGGLWAARRFGFGLTGSMGGNRAVRLAVTERIALDQKRSLALVRHGNTEHLLLLAPEGNILLGDQREETGAALIIDLAACRAHASSAPLPPAPAQPMWPGLPAILPRPHRKPRPDPIPARLL